MTARPPRPDLGLLDPRVFAAIEDLGLLARGLVEGFRHGQHRSRLGGDSSEFAAHRDYRPGDDLRHLNWKLCARHEKLYIKQYDAESNLDCHLVLDVSGSMATHNADSTKRRYAAVLAAALAHLALRQRDAVGLTLFADRVVEHLEPRARAGQLDEVLRALAVDRGRPRAADPGALREVATLVRRRGLVVLISDLFFPAADVLGALDHFQARGHDLLVLQVLDPFERALTPGGLVRFRDLETGEELVTRADEVRAAYQAAVDAWLGELETGCRARGVDHAILITDEPPGRGLARYLGRRSHHY